MSGDGYIHDPDGVSSVNISLDSIIESYSNCIESIDLKLKEIKDSDSWKDEQVKTAYIKTCESYKNSFDAMLGIMTTYRSYLSTASTKASFIESHYA